MILHICPPGNNIFIPAIIDLFEKINPNKNDYLILSKNSTIQSCNNLKNIQIKDKEYISNDYIKYIEERYEVVFVHKLVSKYINFLNKIKKPIKIWSSFGGDLLYVLYNYPLNYLLLPKTKNILSKKNIIYYIQISKIGQIFLFPYKYIKTMKLRNVVRSFDYITTVIPQEYDMLKNKVDNIGKYLRFNYSHFLFSNINDIYICGKNIMIGNAASYDNNHLDAFSLIEHIKLEKRNIITPLSYGLPIYRDAIKDQGYIYFGKNYVPIINILPTNDYKELLLSCSHMIIEGINQHALGNILIGLWNGSKVFLNNKNPVYVYLKALGILLYSTEYLQNNIEEINTVLNEKQMLYNRKIVLNEYGTETIKQRASKMLIDIGYIPNN